MGSYVLVMCKNGPNYKLKVGGPYSFLIPQIAGYGLGRKLVAGKNDK